MPNEYLLDDVTRTTTVKSVLEDIRLFLRLRGDEQIDLYSELNTALYTDLGNGARSYTRLEPSATAERADLFNLGASSQTEGANALIVVVTSPHVAPLGAGDTLQHQLYQVRVGAGNARPLAPPHLDMANALCASSCDHPPSVHLPVAPAAYRKLSGHLTRVRQLPIRCCFNCGMMNYPAPGDRISVLAAGRDDLRAWRVFAPLLNNFVQAEHHTLDEVFLCEPVEPDDAGNPRCRVFTCTACKKARCQDPLRYDLFDGHRADGRGGWAYDPNGVGEPVPEALAHLTCDERLFLGVIKMTNASFEPCYSNKGYMHFQNGAFLQPGDFHGLSTLLVQDVQPEGTNYDIPRVRRALNHLLDEQHGNPIVRETLTCYERELTRRQTDTHPHDGRAVPIMQWDARSLHPGEVDSESDDEGAASGPGAMAARTLAQPAIQGALQTVVEPHGDATLARNAIEHQTVGDRQHRDGRTTLQPAEDCEARGCVGSALHSTLYHKGAGGWQKTEASCDAAHFAKFRLASINDKFRRAHEVKTLSQYTIHTFTRSPTCVLTRGSSYGPHTNLK